MNQRGREYMRTYTYTFMDDSLEALYNLVNALPLRQPYVEFYERPPIDLRTDLENEKWLDYADPDRTEDNE